MPSTTATLPREVPHAYICGITQEVMVDPVVDPDGNSYERAAIEAWLAQKAESPITRQPLSAAQLAPNRALKVNTRAVLPFCTPVRRSSQGPVLHMYKLARCAA